ncbi:MAG: insulinase family protein [Bacteroidetes bacterium]|nr:MAG: insulinase family protein [Bacteroidota bacterium]
MKGAKEEIMKKFIQYISITALIALTGAASAQNSDWRATVPEAGPARTIEIGKYESFTLDNGLKVIVVENHKIPRISYRLFIDRDAIFEGEKAGYTNIAGDLLSTGTANRTKAEIDEEVDFVGGSMSTSSYGGFASSLTRHSDVVLGVFSDVVLNPSFPEDQFDKMKTQMLSGLQSQKDDPNAISGNVSGALTYGLDHPYGEMTTETTVENITLDDCKNYYADYFMPNGSYMVVVGDISPAKAKKQVEKYFGSWEKGVMPEHEYEMPEMPEANEVAFVDKAAAVQSVIRITYPVDLKPGQEDVIPGRVMNSILGSGFSGRLFQNLREDKAYTYGAYSSLGSDELVASFSATASVRNEVTDSAIIQFMIELNRMRDEDVTDDELELAKNFIAGAFARNLESPQTVANFALNTYRYDLPEDYYSSYLERLAAVDKETVRAMAQKYISTDQARIIIVGNKDEVSETLAHFSASEEVTFYDIYANEKAPTMDFGDVSGEDIVNAFITAIGGREALESVKSTKVIMSADAMGQTMEFVEYKMAPGKYSMAMSSMGQTMMRQVFDGESGYVEQQGQKMPLEGSDLENMKDEAKITPELDYVADGYALEVVDLEEINGEMAYKLKVTDGNENSSIHYFSKDTGLKLRSISTMEANGQSVTSTEDFSDYREVSGIMLAHNQVIVGMAPFPLEMKTSSVEVNGEIDPTVFQ